MATTTAILPTGTMGFVFTSKCVLGSGGERGNCYRSRLPGSYHAVYLQAWFLRLGHTKVPRILHRWGRSTARHWPGPPPDPTQLVAKPSLKSVCQPP